MNRRALGGWGLGGVTIAGTAITVISWFGWAPPAFIWPDMEIHLYGWTLLTGAAMDGAIGFSWPFIDQKLFLPRREALERFRGLKGTAGSLHQNFVAAYEAKAEPVEKQEALKNRGVLRSQNLDVRLAGLGIAHPSSTELLELIDMMERGALQEARGRWPLEDEE